MDIKEYETFFWQILQTEDWKKFLEHPQHKNVSFRGGGFQVSGKRVRGLTTRIHAQFGNESYQKKSCPRKSIHSGMKHGTLVHKQLEKFIRSLLKGEHAVGPWDLCTKKILKFLVFKKWVPVCTEFPIADESIGVGTAVDLICVCGSEIILVELKTGYTEYEKSNQKIKGRLAKIGLTRSPLHLHQIQLVCMLEIFRRRYDIKFHSAYILRISLPRIHLYGIAPCFERKEIRDIVYEDIA